MFPSVNTNDVGEVQREVVRLFQEMFPGEDPHLIECAFEHLATCFSGGNPKYQRIDVHYHDLEHTLQGTLCLARLLHGRHRAGAQPPVDLALFRLGILAVLLHDTGYLKRPGDHEGTGAKYTAVHVTRSAEFAAECLGMKNFTGPEIRAVQNMIRCTGVGVDLNSICFQSQAERLVGYALATADLLGQMAAEDYVDKLPVLYDEFREAAAYSPELHGDFTHFTNADELRRNTPRFWSHYVRPRLEHEFGGLYHFLEDPYPGGPNWYLERIEANLARIEKLLAPA
ncbi:MAG: hypothetical protein HS113_26280 [Verrucomicrobiales bacterium]|nr:hypothetical protein [Verrucomicrobiales bacterium]